MSKKNLTYAESKIDVRQLREAVQKVFAYKPSASRKDSVNSPAAKHRKSVPKNAEHTAN